MNKRVVISISSLAMAAVLLWGLTKVEWGPVSAYFAYAILAIVFLGILVSNQQYEEDAYSKIERTASSFLFSYILFFQFCYVPLYGLFFGTFVTIQSFLADMLLLFLFGIFFFLFGTAFLVLNKYSRIGFLSHWQFFNNEKTFFLSRILFIPAVAVSFSLILKKYL